jgi:hypothetical protein
MTNIAICIVFLFSLGSNGVPDLSARSSLVSPALPAAAPVEIFVDGSSGLDANPGTRVKPLKTISRAAVIASANHWNNIPTTITINPGIYRELVQISGTDPNVGTPVTFQASTIGSVIISGSDVWTGWQEESATPGRYAHSWPYAWGTCTVPASWPSLKEIVLRREMVFVNGKLLVQVLSSDQMREGTFYIDEIAKLVHIWPAGVSDIATAVVEVAVRPQLFGSYQVPHLVVRGVVFEHANSCMSTPQRSAVAIVGATDQLLEDSTIQWNNWTGLVLYNVTSSSARRVKVNNNGELGIDGFQMKDLTMEDVEASYNNWRGAWGQFLNWETGGAKFLFTHGAVFKNYKAVSNQGRGIWFDTDNLDITFDQAYLAHNMVNGILLEANMGPFSITNSRICGNYQGGIVTNQTESVALTGNVIFDNTASQIAVYGASGQRMGTNWETREKFTAVAQKWSLFRNTIVGVGASQFLFAIHQSSTIFFGSLSSDTNTWYNAATGNAFQFDTDGHPWNGDFSRWQSVTKQDPRSTFGPPQVDPATLCAAP